MHGSGGRPETRPLIFGCIDFLSGSVGSAVNVMVGLPLDTVKVKMQMYPHLYGGPFHCFKSTYRKYGVRSGLYAGMWPALAADISEKSVLFCAYGYTQFVLNKYLFNKTEEQIRARQQSGLENAISGFFAAFFSAITLCPTELVKCKLQALKDLGHPEKIDSTSVIRKVYRAEGVAGFYKGFNLTLIREMPGYFFYFGGYTVTKNALTAGDPNDRSVWKIAVSGGVGGVCLWSVIYPFDLAKTQIQVTQSNEKISQILRTTYREGGIRGMYRGLTPSIVRTFPSTASLFVVYEYLDEYLTKKANESLGKV